MFKIFIRTFLTLIMAMAFFSCAKTYYSEGETSLERNWGRSFESAKHLQILNPEAGKNLEPVVGREGRVEEKIIERHIKDAGEKTKGASSSSGLGLLTITK